MAKFSKLVITEKGKELLNQKLSSEKAITYTKIALSSHEYAQEGLEGLEQLADIKQIEAVRKTGKEEHDTVVVDTVFDNNSLSEGYFIKAAGLYARLEGQEEILFAVAVELSNASYMPEHTETITAIQLKLRIRLENAENVNIFVDTAGTATIDDVLDVRTSLEEHESNTTVHVSADEKREWNESLNSAKEYSNEIYQQATGYADQKIADLIGGAPETLDTLKEVADAIEENEDVVSALNAAIGNKANQAELDTHVGNGTIHITATERANWNLCGAEKDFLSGKTNIEYSYPDVESNSIVVHSGAESLTNALKDATQKLSETAIETRQELNSNISQYAAKTELDSSGWYRIAKFSPQHVNGYQGASSNGCEIILKRSWGNQKGEYHHLELLWTSERTAEFKSVSDISQNQGITKIRLAANTSNYEAYIEIYYAHSGTNALNTIIIGGSTSSGYSWEAIQPIPVYAAPTMAVFAQTDIPANSLGQASFDENGDNITLYLKQDGYSSNNKVNFTNNDSTISSELTAWTDVPLMRDGERHSTLFEKISTMFKNIRYLYKMLGTTDISGVGDGTVTGAIIQLSKHKCGSLNKPLTNGAAQIYKSDIGIPNNANLTSVLLTPMYESNSNLLQVVYTAQIMSGEKYINIYGRFGYSSTEFPTRLSAHYYIEYY